MLKVQQNSMGFTRDTDGKKHTGAVIKLRQRREHTLSCQYTWQMSAPWQIRWMNCCFFSTQKTWITDVKKKHPDALEDRLG